MWHMVATRSLIRFPFAALLLALLALRLLAPVGFMPAFDHGAVTIVACPGAVPAMPMAGHSDHHKGAFHQLCPYAAAATVAALAPVLALLLATIIFPSAVLIGGSPQAFAGTTARGPPRLRGPPHPA